MRALPVVAPPAPSVGERTHVTIRLNDNNLPYEERLRILRAALAPTADRGAWSRDGHSQDHFTATDHGWRVTGYRLKPSAG